MTWNTNTEKKICQTKHRHVTKKLELRKEGREVIKENILSKYQKQKIVVETNGKDVLALLPAASRKL